MDHPKVFISYSWDSADHSAWVKALAEQLRANNIEAILDKWHVAPGDPLQEFMERAVRESDYVVIVCTPKYKERADKRKGGVGYEGTIMTAEVYEYAQHRKFIPLLRHAQWKEAAPSWMLGKNYINFANYPASDDGFNELVDTILQRREKAPPLGRPKKRKRAGQTEQSSAASKSAAPERTAQDSKRAIDLIRAVQLDTVPLAVSIADVLAFADAIGDDKLVEICNLELIGYRQYADTVKGKSTQSDDDKTAHRSAQYYVSTEQVNIDYFGNGSAALEWMSHKPTSFTAKEILVPDPVSRIEAEAARSSPTGLSVISMSGIYCYGPGDTFAVILRRTRDRLTEMLMTHVKPGQR